MAAVAALLPPDQAEWAAAQYDALTTEHVRLRPSQWAETQRYLPPSVTSLPGFYRFAVAPYLQEIVDCFSVDSPVREVALMKGVQIGATVGVLENSIGYYIGAVKTAPIMLVTADAELVKLRMESYVTPMLQHSGLNHLIKASDEANPRKTGRTDKKLEWEGGGFLVPLGAQNANKLRSISIQVLLRDEIDGWPDVVGKDGDPIKLSADRTAAFEGSRKILDISTPLVKGQSKIEERFRDGDQRYYFVRCIACGFPQTLRWRRTHPRTQQITGIVWETERGRLVPDSVRYLCEECGHPHTNDDKTRLLDPANGAEWRPTSEPASPYRRSYHLSALYAPVGMQTWSGCVLSWLEAWDVEHNRPRDNAKLQVFYNNVLGEPYELRGERLRFEAVSAQRRRFYRFGEVPNKALVQACGSPVYLVTCAVDVHGDCLKVATFGWCRERRAVLLDYWTFEGTPERVDDAGSWGRLRKVIEEHVYVADDGKKYRPVLTFIDSGYLTDTVYAFCSDYAADVYPVKGQAAPKSARADEEFAEFQTESGMLAFAITVDLYKDRWSAALRRQWDGVGLQPIGSFNAPIDVTDAQLKELTVEVKREKIDKQTGKRMGFEWHRPGGAANELWDLLIYSNAALDVLGRVWMEAARQEFMNWPGFWDECEGGRFYTT